MPTITRPTLQLSLIMTPRSDAARDDFSLAERLDHLDVALAKVRELALFWPTTRSDELFEDFEVQLRELLCSVGRTGSELMLGAAEAKDRRERPSKYSIGSTTYRMSTPEPRSFNTWFGVIRYRRSYARPVDGGVGHCPLDFELGLLGDRISPNLLSTGALLATRMSFAEAREVLGWFVPQPPSTEVLEQTGNASGSVRAIGIANQRETTLVWERDTGRPVMNAIVWQCRRSAPLCEELRARGLEETIRARTGLPIDPYFSGTKIRWVLDHAPRGQERAQAGELLFGTVDSWLVWKLTDGAVHVTDPTNASRTMLFNLESMAWDPELLTELNIPQAMLPRVCPSSQVCGYASGGPFHGQSIPIAAIVGDQQAALFGQACFEPGMAKNTYGTGSFVLMNTGAEPVTSGAGLLATVGWQLDDDVTYALEGSIFSTGATVQWLRDELGIIGSSDEVEALAASVPDNGGVYMVPAFAGLGAPFWDMYARGAILGLTRGSGKGHLARAVLESAAHQTRDVLDAMALDTGLSISQLRVDGGASVNGLMMQFQSDILDVPIQRSAARETTALGAAYLAGLAVGMWSSTAELGKMWRSDAVFTPDMAEGDREYHRRMWRRAVERARGWLTDDDPR